MKKTLLPAYLVFLIKDKHAPVLIPCEITATFPSETTTLNTGKIPDSPRLPLRQRNER
jgi:hypothetical protein